jgi:hypothetical protein
MIFQRAWYLWDHPFVELNDLIPALAPEPTGYRISLAFQVADGENVTSLISTSRPWTSSPESKSSRPSMCW